MSGNVIEAQNLTKRYDGATVVKGVSFAVEQGEIFGLLGPNGAGKTTTILMLLGLSDISDGTARVLGHDPEREPLAVKRRVGYLPDQVGFYDNLSAADNLRYIGRLIGLEAEEREDKIAASLAHVGLAEVADHRVHTFSRGMRQRLGLAEILLKDAEIAIRFSTEKLHAGSFSIVTDPDSALLGSAIASTLPGVNPDPHPAADMMKWSEVLLQRRELWPIQYLLPGGAYIR